MPPQNGIEQRLDEIEEKVDESYKILKSVRRKQTIDFWFSMSKLLILVGAFYYAYVFLEPYIDDVKELYISIEEYSNSQGFNFLDFMKGER